MAYPKKLRLVLAAFAGFLPARLPAQAASAPGAQARGSVGIRVSVAPRFEVRPTTNSLKAKPSGATLVHGAGGLRVTLVDATPPGGAGPSPDGTRLLLVVPD